uniref:SH3 domain-containing protein n=1 Tax=Anopheles culicifacies TaxID=139723 RepID=A0A182MD97_9DIPT
MGQDSGTAIKLGPTFKAKTSSLGVWSPFNRSTEVLTKAELAERSPSQNETHASQQPPVWTPRSAPPSPLSERREFRRIGFESPTPTRRTITPSPADPSAVVTPPWNQPGYNPPATVADHSKPIPIKSSPKLATPPPPPPEQGYQQVRFPPLPRSTNSQEPTINSLLKSKGYPYKSSGYQSEPEANYDSDYTIKYSTLDRRRTPVGLSPTSYNKFNTLQSKPATPQPYHQQSVKSGHASYRNQPGRIEDYTPGRSSISEKESKEQLEHQKLTGKTYAEGNLSRALKEQGYESDSTLVFRKREPPVSAALSPVEQKQYYKTMQAGGEIPLQGFRKPAPERPKDHNEEAIESDLVVEIKENNTSSNSNVAYAGESNNASHAMENNIACYPIVNIHRPLDMFGSFLKETRTFVPPVPPSRKSSRSNSTLKIMSQVKTNTFNRRTMLERTTTTTTSAGNQQTAKFRSKSAGPLSFGGGTSSSSIMATSSTAMMKEEKNQENNTRVASKRSTVATYRSSSSSPTGQLRKSSQSPVAFGRGISKERTFAEEKKRIEEKLPKIVSVSTSILRNPELKSPNEVKKALRSSYLPIMGRVETSERSSLKRFSSNGTFRSASSIYSSNKSLNRVSSPATNHRKEDKSFKFSVTSSAKGKDVSQQHLPKRSLNRKSNSGRTSTPSITIKTSFQKASKAFGLKATSSSQSLARSCSTYSIESTNLKSRRSRISGIPSNTVATTRNHFQTQQRLLTGNSLDRGIKALRNKSPTMVQHAYDQRIVQQKGNVRSDAFFQKLFLKTSQTPSNLDSDEKPASVLEKARLWNNLNCRSEPSLKQSNYYLSQAKPVSSSKFKAKERQHNSELSTTYQSVRQIGRDVIEQVHRFESMIKLTENQPEDQNQFGYVRGRRMEIDYSFHERSRSEPPAETTTTTTTSTTIQEELIGTDSPRTIVGRRCQVAQRTSRSPSCRRIQYLKGKEGHVKKIIRTRSLSGNTGQRVWLEKPKDELVRSHSLNLSQEPGVSRSRFRELNTFYNSLERLGQLERVTSSSSNDLRPTRRTREEEIIDYDLWKRVRDQEKAERELNLIKNKLKQDQREKDLFFLPRDPEEVRWRSDQDTGLRNREKSVEDLKCILNEQALSFEDAKLRDLENRKDYYKPLWRGSSVIDVASHLEEKYSNSGEKRDEPQSLDIISSNLLSTLSFEQMKKLKNQLSEIYSNGAQKDPTTATKVTSQVHQQEEYIINVPERASKLESLLKVRSHSVLTQDKINESHLRTQSIKFGSKPNKTISATVESTTSKVVDRAALSRTLCQELKDKILEKHHTLPSIGKKKKHSRPSILAKEEPRFLSLESNLKKVTGDKPTQLARSVSRKESDKEFEVIVRKERPQSYCDTESISSETSNKTVIFRSQSLTHPPDVPPVEDIKTKIKYFEEKQIIDETPTVTIYHAREDSSLSENESGTQRDDDNKTLAAKGTCSSMVTLSQSFTDLKDLFGEKRSVSCSAYTACSAQDSKRTSARKISPKRFTLRSRSSTPDYATCIQTGEVKKIKDKFESLDVNIWRQPPATSASPERQYQSDSELSCQPSGENSKRTTENSGKRQCKVATGSTIVRHQESGDVSRITHKYEVQSERARSRKSRKERVTSPIPKNPFRKDDRFMPHINVISKTASLKREMKPARTSHTHQAATATVLQSTQLPNIGATARSASTGSCTRRSASSGSEEFEKLKSKFESGAQLSLLGKMYTSVPDIRELKDISGYLSGAWIAHQFPRPTDNARSLAAPDQSPPGRQIVRKGSAPSPDRFHRQNHSFHSRQLVPSPRLHSSSPTQHSTKQQTTQQHSDGGDFLKQFYTTDGHTLDDSDKSACERSKSNRRLEVEALWRKIQSMTGNRTMGTALQTDKPSVTFQEPHITFPSPPLKGAQPPPPPPLPTQFSSSPIATTANGAESPRRYIESDVNIHYKTPVRFEYKEPIPDDELAYRQAEHMRRVYQEERRRKYINELEDMHSRRHMDNILPSQKSPIPLNRYDDFAADLSVKPQIVQQPKTIARALYNFQGQSIRDNSNVRPLPKKPSREGKARAKFNFTAQTTVELSLLKGELVTLTRRVDDNWFEGKIGSKKGIFPVSYVEILTDIDGEESYDIEPIAQSALGVTSESSRALTTHYDNSHTNGRISPGIVRETKTIQKTEVLHVDTSNEPISYRALYNYKPQNTDELELLEGDVVYVLEKCDDGWYVGTSARSGCFGTFPGNYVTKL